MKAYHGIDLPVNDPRLAGQSLACGERVRLMEEGELWECQVVIVNDGKARLLPMFRPRQRSAPGITTAQEQRNWQRVAFTGLENR
jgi:hypothetical protein